MYNVTEVQYGFGLADIDAPFSNHYWASATVIGYLFSGELGLGGGLGYNQYNDGYTVPLFADVRYFMGKQRNKFFVAADGGFYVNFENFEDYSRVFAQSVAGNHRTAG